MNYLDIASLLKNVNPLSLWGMSIQKVVADPTEEKITQLVEELNSQAKDNPQIMRDILGTAIFNKIIHA